MTPGPFRDAIDPVTAEVRVCLSNRYAALLEKLVAWQGVDPAERAGPLATICRDATLMSQMAEDILHSWTDRITAADLIDASAIEALQNSGRRQPIPATLVCANPEPASSRRSLL